MASIVEKSGKLFRKYVCSQCGAEIENQLAGQCQKCGVSFAEKSKMAVAEKENKKGKKKEPVSEKKFVQVCPVCGSENFNVYKDNKFLESIGSSINYICKRCGNVFPLPLEVFDGDVKKIREKLEETQAREEVIADTPNEMVVPYGFFLVRFWLLIVGPLSVVIGAAVFLAFPIFGLLFMAVGAISLLIFFWRRKKA